MAFAVIGFGWPVPVLLWLWGPKIRAIGKVEKRDESAELEDVVWTQENA